MEYTIDATSLDFVLTDNRASTESYTLTGLSPARGEGIYGDLRKEPLDTRQRHLASHWRAFSSGLLGRSLSRHWDKLHREELKIDTLFIIDDSTLPGEVVSTEAINHERIKEQCIALLQRMAQEGVSSGFDISGMITAETAQAAIAFVLRLDRGAVIPKVAADGEGGLMMIWRNGDDQTLVTVDGWRLHMVTAATTTRAEYKDNIPFDGERIPQGILKIIQS